MASNSPKCRDYFITINEGAPSYDDALERIKELNIKLYAYIVHDKDKIIEIDKETSKKVEIPKKIHKHAVIELKNPISFSSMQNKFPGAHIETPKYKKSAYQYLIHNLPSAREKYQYDFKEIVSNNLTEVKTIIESETYELFYENRFLQYIADGTRTSYQFAKRFGLNAYKQYWKPYYDMVQELQINEEMQNDLNEIIESRLDSELPF
jgi:hypothetical protein